MRELWAVDGAGSWTASGAEAGRPGGDFGHSRLVCGWLGWGGAVSEMGFTGDFYGFAHGVDGLWRPRLGWVGRVWLASSPDQELQAFAPKTGARASGGPPGAPARRAASLRGEGD